MYEKFNYLINFNSLIFLFMHNQNNQMPGQNLDPQFQNGSLYLTISINQINPPFLAIPRNNFTDDDYHPIPNGPEAEVKVDDIKSPLPSPRISVNFPGFYPASASSVAGNYSTPISSPR
jgi:hypothetical protein